MFKLPLPSFALALVLVAACGGDGGPASPTPTRPAATAPATSTAAVTPSPRPASTATTTPRIDGTVPGEGFGGTDPVTIKSNPDPISKTALLMDVRVGAHPEQGGWDRIVFEFLDVLPPGSVRYVTSASQCGSGEAVRLPGQAILQVRFESVQAHTEAGQPTLKTRQITGPGNVILESVQTCDFEGIVIWAIGVKSTQRFNVRKLENPTRVVIDVKQ